MGKQVTFSDLLRGQPHDPIWVLNTSKAPNRGNVFFGVANALGTKEDAVTIYVTWVPICLTEQVNRKQLLESNEFRRAVTTGMLRLIGEDEAQEILDQEGAAAEADRVRKLSIGSAAAEVTYGLGKEAEQAQQDEGRTTNVSAQTQQFVELMEVNSDSDSLNTLRTMGDLHIDEFRLVLKKAKALSYAQTGKHASEQIKKIKAAGGEDDE